MRLPINQVLVGDCVEVMKTLPAESIDMVMFSPPYWGLRDYGKGTETVWGGNPNCEHKWSEYVKPKERGGYGESSWHRPGRDKEAKWRPQTSNFCVKCGAWRGQLGLEPTYQMYVAHMVMVCRSIKRVLKKTGSTYIVLGDTYYSRKGTCFNPGGGKHSLQSYKKRPKASQPPSSPNRMPQAGLKPKCLVGVPWRVAFSLIEDEGGDFYRLKKEFNNLEVLTITDNNALQRPRETESLLQRICETLEREAQRPVSKTDEGMAGKEPRKSTSIFSEVLLDTSGKGNDKKNEVQCKETSQIETSSSHSLRGQSSEVCVLRGISFTILNNTPYVGIWEQTSPRDKKIWQYLRMVEACELSRRISSVMHELQLCNREIRNLSTSRGRDFWIRKCNIPKELEECFELAKEERWVLRNAIIWHKPNAMPSSVKDRLSNTHEHIFHLVKARRYYYDLDAIRAPHSPKAIKRAVRELKKGLHSKVKDNKWLAARAAGLVKDPLQSLHGKSYADTYFGKLTKHDIAVGRIGNFFYTDPLHIKEYHPKGKNPGDFWSIRTKPFKKAHFAVYPEEICVRPIKSSCPPDGVVLDPMCGSGTTLVVAKKLGRRWVGIDINPDYVEMTKARLSAVPERLTKFLCEWIKEEEEIK